MLRGWTLLLCFVAVVGLAACATTAAPPDGAPGDAAIPTVEGATPADATVPAGAGTAAGVPPECADDTTGRACAVFGPGESIKIGFAGPMTGDSSAFGTDISQAGQLAIEAAEPLAGRSFELEVQDTQGTGEGGAQVANKYASDPRIVAIAGHTFSGSAAAAIPIYNEARIPMLSASATRADLTQGDQDVFNRIAFTDDVQGTQAATYLYDKLNVRKLALVHDGDAYGEGLANKVREVFTSKGGEVVAYEAITKGEADYSGPLTAIGAAAPDALYFGGYYAEAAVLKNQMAVAGLGDAVFFSDDGTYGQSFLDLTGANGEGAYATSARPPSSARVDEFEALYEERYGTKAGSLSTFTWHGYDIVAALVSAIRSVAVESDDGNLYVPRDALVQAVRGLEGFEGLTGTITCSEVGECNTAGPSFFVVQDGQWVQAP